MRVVRAHKGHAAIAAATSRASPPTRAIPTWDTTRSSRRRGRSWRSRSSGGRWRRSARRTTSSFPKVPFAALNVGTIAGGSASNVVPDRCEVDLGIRLLPGMAAAAMADRVRATVADALGAEPFTLEHVNLSPPMIAPADAPIHRELCEAVHQHDEHSVMFATDAGWLQDAGFQCVLFGPGQHRGGPPGQRVHAGR